MKQHIRIILKDMALDLDSSQDWIEQREIFDLYTEKIINIKLKRCQCKLCNEDR